MEVKIGHPESRSRYIDQKNKTESLEIDLHAANHSMGSIEK